MTAVLNRTWAEANQQYLADALSDLRALLEQGGATADGAARADDPEPDPSTALHSTVVDGAAPDPLDPPPALEVLSEGFGLSSFERLVLLMCAAVELEAGFSGVLSVASGGRQEHPSFGLALATLPDPHWSALSPGRPLRRHRLVDLVGTSPTAAELRIDERVLHVITGTGDLDLDLGGLLRTEPVPERLVGSQTEVMTRLADTWIAAPDVVPQLLGRPGSAKREIAAMGAGRLGHRLAVLDSRLLPGDPRDIGRLATVLDREPVLSRRLLCIDADDNDHAEACALLADSMATPVVVCTREPLELRARTTLGFDVRRAGQHEQVRLWRELRGDDEEVRAVVEQFDLEPQLIRRLARLAAPGELWDRCKASARPRLGALAQRVEPAVGLTEIVLPAAQLDVLARIAAQVRHRRTVFETWGMHGGGGRGTGTTALFAGPSGTGKTLAAEVLAGELGLDLYRVDLSAVVSKYIGETEKNLRRVFDSADEGSAVLLFDEADALFGRRTEVKDSHDRFANIEVSYLLQRMEQYQGLAILTTNMHEAVDPAFERRIRFVITFPFPDAGLREQIWSSVFGPQVPLVDFDPHRLARLGLTGGSIRNIAINAAFRAATDSGPVRMAHLVQAARDECARLDQPWPGDSQ
jgi:hypothetical protein